MNTKPISRNISRTKDLPIGLRPRVFVGLSGGVDSAVSAALLKEQGYDVTGVFIRAWQPEWLSCTWREERRDAMKICLTLGIPFLFLDAEAEYKKDVVDKMIAEYKAGRTPNPDVLCNKEIKFGVFWNKAKELGADFIATGHYLSGEKDQSYFLWMLTPDDFSHTIFPVGHMEKSEVRKLAKKYNLPVAEKKDSQGICFMGNVSMEEFLSHYVKAKRGKVMNTEGAVIGRHDGLPYYTVGERKGFEVTQKGADNGPFYIVAKDADTNTLVVSDEESEILEFSPRKIILKNVNWIREPESPELTGQVRYRGEKLPIRLSVVGRRLSVEFKTPVRGLSLGQSLVFYENGNLLGGGIMDKIIS
ncbi:MAG: tRNA 2-thiouridine(34) synthase MnmA [Candidatus Zambryskibacteria bacterium RIFCSPLOWO2_02_FULL_51_21]|uniref:tRNA-specific 2-thiouridylase MnmA n=1 Tax=Candidatus Zambryskibacteria bacterium RIFCSPHIGHO2_02_FULL_43_37 TaxID=1802749 RepID=A0A1G2THK4_9BACT|nr:MAG: tRNA 2-thiouridine(34) synthase MnmA [Candidatus Zambryskibacteria bacterium RIFCSPHIGHO2_01_FULL_52_18]OHA96538.1 MAG: tRNA 2-thiouridine(34) synthase MnmA [Candidatus Zambryskibacteria bacterium RIFCSPHIGHO2_02_FULL_43_37]OHB11198.1 MAG: tRNA 2-thiouridine(34) synthase MnmA [Candidatus Zambryskibacteria bacterium RIFCSPLOWO2_02_FULL_51_21]